MPIVQPASMPEPFDRIFADLGISAQNYTHPQTFTVEQSREWEHLLPGGHTKNLFLNDKNKNLWLITAIADTRIDLKKLAAHLGVGRFSFGNPEKLQAYLGVTPGSVTPLALINDESRAVRLIWDSRLFDYECVNCHPLRNDMTTALSPADLDKFAVFTGHTAMRIDFTAI